MERVIVGLPNSSAGKESTYSVGDTEDMGSVPGLGRSPGEGNGNPLQYSCQGNSMDKGDWQATVHGVAKALDMTEPQQQKELHLVNF